MDTEKNEIKVLIADDNPSYIHVLSSMLTEQGYTVTSVRNGQQAIERIATVNPDLILLDIHMPKMDGYETCKFLKRDEKYKNIPVIFISGLTESFNKMEAFDAGAVDYITKPFQIEEVLARVNVQLSLQQKNTILEKTLKQLQDTQAQLIHSEKMASLGILTAGIAHEINNPVNYISSSIQGLKQVLDDIVKINRCYSNLTIQNFSTEIEKITKIKNEISYDETLELFPNILENITVGVDRITDIIKGLRLFTRTDVKEKVFMDIHENLETSILLLKNKLSYQILINRNYSLEIPKILCHPGKINQVFMNILANAIDAIYSKQQLADNEIITISTYKQNNSVFIEISDTGCGITEEVKNHIFDPFYTTKEIGKGTGLGLYISHSIIAEHNGTIQVKSKTGEGTVFTISIPIL